MNKNKSIIYINFAPYENAGRIMDFLQNHFFIVAVFTFDFHKLNSSHQFNYLKVYKEGKEIYKVYLFKLPTPEALLFISLPFIALVIVAQSIWHIWKLSRKFGKFDFFLTVNALTAWVGVILRKLKCVDRVIFWIWDYYPPGYPDWKIRIARWAYWKFDSTATLYSDKTVFLNERLVELRKKINILPKKKKYFVLPIGTNPALALPYLNRKKFIIGHLGVLKKSQGLDLLFDNFEGLYKEIPNLQLEIIGSGPDEEYFKSRSKGKRGIKFFGYIKDDNMVDEIIRGWNVGMATYKPDESNAAYWTDPSKIKAYVSQGIPVITTSITPFSKTIKLEKAGIVVDYFDGQKFITAVVSVWKKQEEFRSNAYSLAKKYSYESLYPNLFSSKAGTV